MLCLHVSEWSALGSVVAVFTSLALGALGYVRSYHAEAERRTDEARAQASKVAAWQQGSHDTMAGVAGIRWKRTASGELTLHSSVIGLA